MSPRLLRVLSLHTFARGRDSRDGAVACGSLNPGWGPVRARRIGYGPGNGRWRDV